MKNQTLSAQQINELIKSNADPSLVANEIHLWELEHGIPFEYPPHKPQFPTYIHPDFGEVRELR